MTRRFIQDRFGKGASAARRRVKSIVAFIGQGLWGHWFPVDEVFLDADVSTSSSFW